MKVASSNDTIENEISNQVNKNNSKMAARDYFDSVANSWSDAAYDNGGTLDRYPTGAVRTAIALERARIANNGTSLKGVRLLDLGCGSGDLALDAVADGAQVTGVDIASEMISQAMSRYEALTASELIRPEFHVGDVESYTLDDGEAQYDVVTAMGLIEYLESDQALLGSVKNALTPGGQFFIQCRNRLFNLGSANNYLSEESEAGAVPGLIAELDGLSKFMDGSSELSESVESSLSALAALKAMGGAETLVEKVDEAPLPDRSSQILRRQHTPSELADSCESAGLRLKYVEFYRLHPLPPAARTAFPRFYNQLSMALQPLGHLAEVAPIASSFVACIEHAD